MRHNHRPPLHASRMYPNHLSLVPGEPNQVTCPDCGRWRTLVRSMLTPHATDMDTVDRCPGSGQRVRIDLHPVEWANRLAEAEAETNRLRAPDGRPRHRNPYDGISEPPLPGDVNPEPEHLPVRL